MPTLSQRLWRRAPPGWTGEGASGCARARVRAARRCHSAVSACANVVSPRRGRRARGFAHEVRSLDRCCVRPRRGRLLAPHTRHALRPHSACEPRACPTGRRAGALPARFSEDPICQRRWWRRPPYFGGVEGAAEGTRTRRSAVRRARSRGALRGADSPPSATLLPATEVMLSVDAEGAALVGEARKGTSQHPPRPARSLPHWLEGLLWERACASNTQTLAPTFQKTQVAKGAGGAARYVC